MLTEQDTRLLGTPQPSQEHQDGLAVTVLIPAHNEEATIEAAIMSLWEQERRPDQIVVVADNCSDRTVALALGAGAQVLETIDNTDKKAGGLNQALDLLLPGSGEQDNFMIMDADTALVPEFLDTAMSRLATDPDLGAVGGLFFGEPGGGLVGALQRNEYTRYQRDLALNERKVMVLSGTASVFRAQALRAVATARGDVLPGRHGQVYDTLAMTEDNELTVALKTLGYQMVSPAECRNVTEVMTDWKSLWRQRERWQRGAIENLRVYGWTPTTRKYWGQQLGIAYGVLSLQLFFLLLIMTMLSVSSFAFYPFWIGVSLVFVIERVVTVWPAGWKARLIAAPLVIEIFYDIFIQAVFVKSVYDAIRRKDAGWNYVPREA